MDKCEIEKLYEEIMEEFYSIKVKIDLLSQQIKEFKNAIRKENNYA